MAISNLQNVTHFMTALGLPIVLIAQAHAAGFVDKNNNLLPEITLASQYVEYRCPLGGGFDTILEEKIDFTGYFQANHATAPNLRVRIENLTSGFTDTPYTDRAYDNGTHSEKIKFAADTKHRNSTFSVASLDTEKVLNSFEYRVFDKKTGSEVETGEFTALVSHQWLPNRVIYNDPSFCRDPFPPVPFPPIPVPPVPSR